jgi:hypothetical protein
MKHARLLFRLTGAGGAVYAETSLYESNVTLSYILEQVTGGKEAIINRIVLGPTLAAALMPLLDRISRGEDVPGP